ncbi:MAG: bifunctional DNA-formamidopyrimidine glycosylase/DNA-(apurinic or apyrimidinic site) lyase [Deltaproteobacteria bacterium]|jgi:formamidopyrimidine-DNA glycosylase|nr:bifunctional DNA-formamidopyrimidine glycosylase/DNA-(apurinic or apyrimidinic site) lyase [Deltaproteobacteria bacterium]
MPELPEAETMARDLDRRVSGRTISSVLVSFPPIVASDREGFAGLLSGQTIERVRRLGKWIRIDLASGGALLVHLKMTGQFLMGDWPGSLEAPWPPQARAAFLLTGGGLPDETLFYLDTRKFGRLRAFPGPELAIFLDGLGLGPDPLALSPGEFHRLLASRRGHLKAVLLDQSVVSGVGNIYADESLFAAGLSPLRPASSLGQDESASLLSHLRRILQESIDLGGSTVGNYRSLGADGAFQDRHLVYGKHGQRCPRCGQTLSRASIGGRSTVLCPSCQR